MAGSCFCSEARRQSLPIAQPAATTTPESGKAIKSRPELGLFRVWSFTAVGPFLLPEDINASFNLNTYPMTDAARQSVAKFNRAKDNPTLNCKAKGMPMIMENPYPDRDLEKGQRHRDPD